MSNINQSLVDKLAIGLSSACAVHCAVLPIIFILAPSLAQSFLGNEEFHITLLFFILPTSIAALFMGCTKHKDMRVLALISVGLLIVVAAAFVGHDLFGEIGERVLTTFGSILIVAGHIVNQRLCSRADACCHHS